MQKDYVIGFIEAKQLEVTFVTDNSIDGASTTNNPDFSIENSHAERPQLFNYNNIYRSKITLKDEPSYEDYYITPKNTMKKKSTSKQIPLK